MSHHSRQLPSKYLKACRSTFASLSASAFYGQREVYLTQKILLTACFKVREIQLLIFICTM